MIELPGEEDVGSTFTSVGVGCGGAVTATGVTDSPVVVQAVSLGIDRDRQGKA